MLCGVLLLKTIKNGLCSAGRISWKKNTQVKQSTYVQEYVNVYYFACTHLNTHSYSNRLQNTFWKRKSLHVGTWEHVQTLKYFFRHEKCKEKIMMEALTQMWRLLLKKKDNSLLANCSHLGCENAIHSPMLTGLLSEIVKDLNKKSKCIYPT